MNFRDNIEQLQKDYDEARKHVEEGKAAWCDRKTNCTNPYPVGSEAYKWWDLGWFDSEVWSWEGAN